MKIVCQWCLKDFFAYAVQAAVLMEENRSGGFHNSGTISQIDTCPHCAKKTAFIAVYNVSKCYDVENKSEVTE